MLRISITTVMTSWWFRTTSLAFVLLLAVGASFALAADARYECDSATISASWYAVSQYNVTKYEYYDADGNVLEMVAGHNGVFTYDDGSEKEKVGLWVPSIQGGWYPPEGWVEQRKYAYRIFSLHTSSGSSDEVVVEIEYVDFSGSAADFDIKELEPNMGSRIGSLYQYPEKLIGILEEAQSAETLEVDSKNETFCPLDRKTLRFEATTLPTGKMSEVVFAIVPAERGLEATPASFRIKAIRVYECGGDYCVKPKETDVPDPVNECVAFDTGTIDTDVEQYANLHLRAVPSAYATKEIFLRTYWQNNLPSGFYINHMKTKSAWLVFSSGASVDLPDNCKYVAAQTELGSQWAELRVKAHFQKFDLLGQLVDEWKGEKTYGRWEWTVVEPPESPSLAKRVNISRLTPVERIFYDDGSGRTPLFDVGTAASRYYAVEVATDDQLFDASQYASRRNNSNFFNSWWGGAASGSAVVAPLQEPSDSAMFTYALPDAVWTNLSAGAQASGMLYYRILVSDDPQGTNAYKTFEDNAYQTAPFAEVASPDEPYVITDRVGDKDDFTPGDGADDPQLSSTAVNILAQIAEASPTWKEAVALDVAGANRPLALTHRISPVLNVPIRSASLRFVFAGQEWIRNDLFIFRGPYTSAMTVVVLKDLLGEDPESGKQYDVTVDLSRVPVRIFAGPEDWIPPGGAWPERDTLADAQKDVRNLLSELRDGQLDLVFVDDVRLNFSELTVTYDVGSETPAGEDVVAAPDYRVYVQFDTTHYEGVTSATRHDYSNISLPEDYQLAPEPLYYDIQTTAAHDGPLTVQMHYDPSRFGDEGKIRLLHEEDGLFVDRTIAIDMENKWVTGRMNSLSQFMLAEFVGTAISITDGQPSGKFQSGHQTDDVTPPGKWRWAEYFYGFDGIDEIKWKTGGCGKKHNYAVGWHQNDLIEYLMEFGERYNQIILRGRADRPGPVKLNVYIDGKYLSQVSWDNADNCNQDITLHIPWIPFGTHAIAIAFADDYWDRSGRADGDRNMYLDGLKVVATEALRSITGGKPAGAFDTGHQTDEVTEPGRWRWSRYYYGFEGIDRIRWKRDACGRDHNYVIGWHAEDLAEYLMTFGGDYKYLTVRGIADRPGPVKLRIYIDAVHKATVKLSDRDNCNQDVTVEIPDIVYGTHAIAVEFANDYWDRSGRDNGDRNMYLDGLYVSD